MRWQNEVGSTEECAGRCCDTAVEASADLHPIELDRGWPAWTFDTVLIGIAHHSICDYRKGANQCLTMWGLGAGRLVGCIEHSPPEVKGESY